MKRVSILFILLFSFVFLTSCTKNEPKITVENSKGEYFVGEELDCSLVSIVLDFDGDLVRLQLTKEMIGNVSFDSVGNKEIAVKFTYQEVEYQTTFSVSVVENKKIASASLQNSKTVYLVNQTVDLEAMKIVVYYENGDVSEYPVTSEMLNKNTLNEVKEETIIVNTKIDNQDISLSTTINVIEIANVEVIGLNNEYTVGDSLELNNAIIALTLSDGTKYELVLSENMITGADFATEGEKELKIKYEYLGQLFEISYLVVVSPALKVAKIEVLSNVGNIFKQYAEFDYENTTLLVTYEDGSTETINVTPSMVSMNKFDETGEFPVTVTYKEASVEIIVKVFNEEDYEFEIEDYQILVKTLADINAIGDEIAESMPAEATDDLNFITNSQNKYIISWLSDNPDVIDIVGKVNPKEETVVVHLIAKIYSVTMKHVFVEREFDVTVPGLGPVVLKDITGRKLVFAYTYTGTGSIIREEDYKKIDVINICFAGVNAYGLTISTAMDSTLREITKLRREAGIRIVLSLGGGGSGSEGFSSGCLTGERRTNLVNQLIEAAEEYGLDGFDLDWEYPGWTGLTDCNPAVDSNNFTLLCEQLRVAMDEYRPGMLLTSAVIGGLTTDGVLKYYDLPRLNKCMDYLHLMTYDLNANNVVTHNSNLYSYSRPYSGDNSVKIYAAGGFDKEKLVIGAAFYGKKFTLSTPTTASSAVLNKSASSCTSIQYDVIVDTYMKDSSFVLLNDDIAKIHYLTDGKTVIVMENPTDIKTKTQYVFDNNLGGIMFWDYGSDDTGSLLNAIYTTIHLNEQ